MNRLKHQAHYLIDQLADEDLAGVWTILCDRYYDAFMLQAIQTAKQTLKPGDTLTREEALRFLTQR